MMHRLFIQMNAGECFHDFTCLCFRIRTTGGTYPVKFRHVYASFTEFILGYERMLSFEQPAQFPLGKPGPLPDLLERISDNLAQFAIDGFLHAPILGTQNHCPQIRDKIK